MKQILLFVLSSFYFTNAWIGRYGSSSTISLLSYSSSSSSSSMTALKAIPFANVISMDNNNSNNYDTDKETTFGSYNFQNCTFFQMDEAFRVCIGRKGQLRPYLTNSDNNAVLYTLMVVESENDDTLPAIADLSYECFKQEIIVHYDNMSTFEAAIVRTAVDWFIAYTDKVGYEEIFTGMKQRIKNGSIILAMVGDREGVKDVLGTVEVRMLPPNGKIPFSQPWLDDLEVNAVRAIPSYNYLLHEDKDTANLQPYLCNLCVSEKSRGRGLGKALLRCVENVITSAWGCNQLYLHVNPKNEPAVSLYQNEGFVDTGKRWNPLWAGEAVNIAYMMKEYK